MLTNSILKSMNVGGNDKISLIEWYLDFETMIPKDEFENLL